MNPFSENRRLTRRHEGAEKSQDILGIDAFHNSANSVGKPFWVLSVIALHHGAHDTGALPFFRAVPGQAGTGLLGFRLVTGGATSEEEEACRQEETIPQSLGK